jgi:RHS repeat-associated protein
MRPFRLIACLLVAASLAFPSLAKEPSAARALSDDTVRQLRETLASGGLHAASAVRRYLDDSRRDAEEDGKEAAASGGQRIGSRLAARAAELASLRDQARQDLAAMKAAALAAGAANAAERVDTIAALVEQRFDRVDASFKILHKAATPDARRQARHDLRAMLESLRHEDIDLPATVPVPTLSPKRPAGEPAHRKPSAKLPLYAQAGEPPRRLVGFDGYRLIKAANTPPPVAAEAAADCGAGNADLIGDGKDVQLTQPIKDLAASLGYSPARILRWMQQSIAFEPYWGGLKGAEGVLETRAGNSTDQSSLFIALLRASNVPARYVRGTVRLFDHDSQDNVNGRSQRWLGAKTYQASSWILAKGGINAGIYNVLLSDNVTTERRGVRFDHVWVEACVPYGSYRGAPAEAGGYRWLALDAAVKDHDYQQGIAVNVPLTKADFYDPYLANRKEQLPHEYYAAKTETAARTVDADASVEDVPYKGTPKSLRYDVLPGSLPYEVESFADWPGLGSPEAASLPDAHRHSLTITVKNGASTLASATLPYPQNTYKRITLSYQPDAASQAAWIAWGGALPVAPDGSIKVYPQIKAEGTVLAAGPAASAMPLATVHTVILKFAQGEQTGADCINDSGNPADAKDPDATCVNKTVYTSIKAGAYHALGVNALHTSAAYLADRADLLAEGARAYPTAPTPAAGAGYEATVGELLHFVLQQYLHQTEHADRRTAELRGFRSIGPYDLGLTASDLKTDYIFDIPVAVKPAGVFVDFKGGIYGFVKLDTAATTGAALQAEGVDLAKLSIYSGSALEHHVWQQTLRTDAVSTVRGLQYAAEKGIPLVTFNSANIGQFDSLMQISGATSMTLYKTAIQNAVKGSDNGNHGVVTVPREQIAYEDPVDPSKKWTGAIYMTENGTTGEYGAIINGKIAGGFPLLNSTSFASLFSFNFVAPVAQNSADGGTGALEALPGGFLGQQFNTVTWGDPVNMLTGNYTHQERDFTIKGRGGLPIVLERGYNSASGQDGPFGHGWTHSLNHQLRFYGVESGQAKVGWVDGSGGQRYYATTSHSNGNIASGTLNAQDGVFTQLSRLADGRYQVKETNGLTYTFESVTNPATPPAAGTEPKAKLLSIADRNVNTLTLNYTGGQLATVTDSLSRTVLTFTWNGGRISKVKDLANREFQYFYEDGNGNLTRVIDPLAQTTRYSYYTTTDGTKLNHAMRRVTRPRGNGMEFEYYAGGQVFRHTPFDTAGALIEASALTFHYNLHRRESWSVDGRGGEQRFVFDKYGNLVAQTAENGAVHSYVYADPNDPHLRTQDIDPIGRTTNYTYSAAGHLETRTLPSGAVLEYRDYTTTFAQPQRVKDARGNWTLNRFDAAGNLTDVIRAKAGVVPVAGVAPAAANIVAWTKYQADSVGNLTGIKRLKDWSGATLGNFASGSGPSLVSNYDASKLNLQTLSRSGTRNSGAINETSPTFVHDNLGRLTGGVDDRWYAAGFGYDALDRVIQGADALGQPRNYRFDANGNRTGMELVAGGNRADSATLVYDAQDRPIRVLDHAGNRTATTYDEVGNAVSVQGPDGYAIGFDYDIANRPFSAYDQEGNRVYTSLDVLGRLQAVTDPNGATTTYDYHGANQDGRLARVELPAIPGQAGGRATESDTDAGGLPVRLREVSADGQARESYRFYDELGRLVRSVSPPDDSGQRLQVCYSYDGLSHLIQLRAGATTDTTSTTCVGSPAVQATQTWDDFGNLVSRSDALGRTWIYTYDSHGNLIESKTPEQAKAGLKTTYTYDATVNGLLQTRSVPGSAGQSVSYSRNALGQVTRAETKDGSGTTIVAYDTTYDAAHRVAGITDSRSGKTLAYTWTPGGRLATITLDGHAWAFKYDGVGRLSALVAPNGQTVAYARDAGGRLLERRWPNGVRSNYAWHPDGSLAAIQHHAGGTTLADLAYTFDVWGNRASGTESVGGTLTASTYGYDSLNRLKSVTAGGATETTTVDLFGNRSSRIAGGITTSYLHDAAQQLTEIQQNGVTAERLVYDDNGNLKKHCAGAASGNSADCTGSDLLTLAWNGLDQLIQASKSGLPVETYAYDDSGRRLRKSVGGTSTHYAYDGPDLIAEYANPAQSPSAVYAHGAGIDEPLLRLTGSTNSPGASARYYAQDGVGSVIALLQSGEVKNQTADPTNTLSSTGDYSAGSYPVADLANGVTVISSSEGWVGRTDQGAAATLSFPMAQAIERVELMAVSNYKPAAFVIEQKNADNSWTAIASGTGDDFAAWADNSSVRAVKSFPPVVTTALRVRFTASTNGVLVWLSELQAWSAPGFAAATQRFDAWGNVAQSAGSIPQFGYTGREPDATGLIYYRARYYHPGSGRFASRDPLGFAAGINPYAYADGNPIRYNDPDGLLAKVACNGGCGAALSSYYSAAKDTASNFVSGLNIGGTVDQFGRKLASDFVNNNQGSFGAQGWLADKLAPYAQGYDGSSSNGQLAGAMAIGATLLTPGGAVGKAKGIDEVASASNYRALFSGARPDLPSGWQVHHSMPQKYEELMGAAGLNIHDVQFLRGVSPQVHSKITTEWGRFDKAAGGSPSAAQVADFAKQLDRKYEGTFMWPGF